MRLLITGIGGFLGGSVGRLAVGNGYEVLGIGRSSEPRDGWPYKYLQTDVAYSDLSLIIRAFAPDVVLHAAGSASVNSSFGAPLDDLRASILTWANTLDSIRRSNLRPLVIFPSSAAVYGNPTKLPVPEDAVIAPISPYGFHKAACELLAREYSECFGVNVVTCRFFSTFGPDQRRLLIWELYEQFTGAESNVWLEGSGEESRDFLDIEDAASILFQLINKLRQRGQKSQSAGIDYQVINIATGEEIRVLHLAQQIRRILGSSKPICCRRRERLGDPQRWRADISLLRTLIPSWRPKPLGLSLSQCLAAWQREHYRLAAHL